MKKLLSVFVLMTMLVTTLFATPLGASSFDNESLPEGMTEQELTQFADGLVSEQNGERGLSTRIAKLVAVYVARIMQKTVIKLVKFYGTEKFCDKYGESWYAKPFCNRLYLY